MGVVRQLSAKKLTAGVRFNGSDNYRNPARKPRKFLRLAGK